MAIPKKDPFNTYKYPALNKMLNGGVKAGTSLVTEPGKMSYERPPVFNSDVAFIEDDVVPNLTNPQRVEDLVNMIALGLSPQAISYMYVTDAMSKGLINPDVAEISRPQIEAITLQQVLAIDPTMPINLPKEPKRNSLSTFKALETMKVTNPPMYEKLSAAQNQMDKQKRREKAEEIISNLTSDKKVKEREAKKSGFLGV